MSPRIESDTDSHGQQSPVGEQLSEGGGAEMVGRWCTRIAFLAFTAVAGCQNTASGSPQTLQRPRVSDACEALDGIVIEPPDSATVFRSSTDLRHVCMGFGSPSGSRTMEMNDHGDRAEFVFSDVTGGVKQGEVKWIDSNTLQAETFEESAHPHPLTADASSSEGRDGRNRTCTQEQTFSGIYEFYCDGDEAPTARLFTSTGPVFDVWTTPSEGPGKGQLTYVSLVGPGTFKDPCAVVSLHVDRDNPRYLAVGNFPSEDNSL